MSRGGRGGYGGRGGGNQLGAGLNLHGMDFSDIYGPSGKEPEALYPNYPEPFPNLSKATRAEKDACRSQMEFAESMRWSRFWLKESTQKDNDLPRYSDKYLPPSLSASTSTLQPTDVADRRNFPPELYDSYFFPTTTKKRKSSKPTTTKKKKKIDLDNIGSGDDGEGDGEDEGSDGDDSDEPEGDYDEEDENDNDYGDNYFDNGEGDDDDGLGDAGGGDDARQAERRRHHSKIKALSAAASSPSSAAAVDVTSPISASSTTDTTSSPLVAVNNAVVGGPCSDGAWSCSGKILQQCVNSKWLNIQTCSSGTVCSSTGGTIGCVWPYQVAEAQPSATKTILSSDDLPSSAPATTFSTIPVVYTSVTQTPASATSAPITFSPSSIDSAAPSSTSASGAPSSAPASSSGGMRWVTYSDYPYMDTPPSASELGPVTVFILAFWLSDLGAVDNAGAWTLLSDSQRSAVKADYKTNGKTLLMSAFGSTDTPTTSGYNAQTLAQNLAEFVSQYQLDGVDIDYEDFAAFNGGSATQWLIDFQTTLRKLLPKPYIITHAPVAPWFTSSKVYAGGGYLGFHQAVGSGVDWYNIQFYNQGSTEYTSCQGLIDQSSNNYPDTAVNQLIASGLSPSQVVVGKPSSAGQASNGYMSSSLLGQCMSQAPNVGGVMFWQFEGSSETTNFISTALSAIKK